MTSKIKLIVFDLDGTLVDSRDTHYHALNDALREATQSDRFLITREEHYSTYDGLPTSKKLEMLSSKKGLDRKLHSSIWGLKQKYTEEYVNTHFHPDERLIEMLKTLKNLGYLLYVASNCTWKNMMMICLQKGFLPYLDWLISNEDVRHPKPSSEMYFQCLQRANVTSSETLIVEDSPVGKKAALGTGARLLPVLSPDDLSLAKVLDIIEKGHKMNTSLVQKKCTVVIPMAGHGSRFSSAGYTFPKPLIEVKNKPMIEVVVRNLGLDPSTAQFVFIVQKAHFEKYHLPEFLEKIAPGCKIVQVEGVTEGAACSVLLAREYIDNDLPLVLANSDQFVEWDPAAFFYQMENVDAGIASFRSSHPKWSYAKLDSDGFVSEVAEKKVISEHATVGIYYYRHGSDFVKAARQMIEKNIRVNNEFYVCPVFNELVSEGKKIRLFDVNKMWGIGVPEDLEYFLNNYKGDV
jgi:HAD superfamily hydrolase (TIGR01509 family)